MSWFVKRVAKGNKKSVTVRDVLFAMLENGLPQARGTFWSRKKEAASNNFFGDVIYEGEVGSACALGQAALNLGVSFGQINSGLYAISPDLRGDIIDLNDNGKKSIQEIFDVMKARYSDKFDLSFEVFSDIAVTKH
jgi:hypothetical protein